jgi:hypothetical protein
MKVTAKEGNNFTPSSLSKQIVQIATSEDKRNINFASPFGVSPKIAGTINKPAKLTNVGANIITLSNFRNTKIEITALKTTPTKMVKTIDASKARAIIIATITENNIPEYNITKFFISSSLGLCPVS